MKTKNIFFLILIISTFSFAAKAQEGYEEVVYLKSGNVYRGMIIEQIPNESIKIQSRDGNVFSVPMTDLLKITKEKKFVPVAPKPTLPPLPPLPPTDRGYHSDHGGNYMHQFYDTTGRHHFYNKKKGYFFEAQIVAETKEAGLRIINGYKFGRLGYLGIGVGIDITSNRMFRMSDDNNDGRFSTGVYLPLYLRYSGDILKKRITPFYSIEMGYAAHFTPRPQYYLTNQYYPYYNTNDRSFGGPMGGVALGVKFKTAHRVSLSISANADIKTNFQERTDYVYDPIGNYYPARHTDFQKKLFFGLRFGIGF